MMEHVISIGRLYFLKFFLKFTFKYFLFNLKISPLVNRDKRDSLKKIFFCLDNINKKMYFVSSFFNKESNCQKCIDIL